MENTLEQRKKSSWFWYLCRFGIVAVFVASAVPKFFNVDLFRVTIEAYYGFLPAAVTLPLALVFPWVELGLALILLVLERWQKQASLGLLLLSAFFFVQSIVFYNHWMPYGCGCFGFGEAEVLGYDGIIRNGAILLLAFLAFWGCVKGYALWERKPGAPPPAPKDSAELEETETALPAVEPALEAAHAELTPSTEALGVAEIALRETAEQAGAVASEDDTVADDDLLWGEVVEAIELAAPDFTVVPAPLPRRADPARLGGVGARRPLHRWVLGNPLSEAAEGDSRLPEAPPLAEDVVITKPQQEAPPQAASEPPQPVEALLLADQPPFKPADHLPKQVVAKRKQGKKAPRHHTVQDEK